MCNLFIAAEMMFFCELTSVSIFGNWVVASLFVQVYNGPPGGYGVGGDTLRGAIEDDRRSHFSMATSVVSTIPLSTQPAATKTMSGLYALLLIMLGVAVTAGWCHSCL